MCKRTRQRSDSCPARLERTPIRDKNRRESHGDNVRGSVVPLERYWCELRRLQYKLRQLRRRLERGIKGVDIGLAKLRARESLNSHFEHGESAFLPEDTQLGLRVVSQYFKAHLDAYDPNRYPIDPAPSVAPSPWDPTRQPTLGRDGKVWVKLHDGAWVPKDESSRWAPRGGIWIQRGSGGNSENYWHEFVPFQTYVDIREDHFRRFDALWDQWKARQKAILREEARSPQIRVLSSEMFDPEHRVEHVSVGDPVPLTEAARVEQELAAVLARLEAAAPTGSGPVAPVRPCACADADKRKCKRLYHDCPKLLGNWWA